MTVELRKWRPDDAEWYIGARDETIFEWTTEPRVLDPQALRQVIESNNRDPQWVACAITDASTGALLGNIALTLTEDVGEVMYWVAAESRGRGVATDAVQTLVRWAFHALPIQRIDLLMKRGNEASAGVARNAGFEPRGDRDGRLVFVRTRTLN